MKQTWNETDFEQMSWHDNAVHGLRIIEGPHGSGDVVFDLDHILEWLPAQDPKGRIRFRIAPAELTFHEATELKLVLDYAAASAALTPFSIHTIRFEPVIYLGGAQGKRWIVEINWPKGEITFESPRFTQVLTGQAMVSERQQLSSEQRAPQSNA